MIKFLKLSNYTNKLKFLAFLFLSPVVRNWERKYIHFYGNQSLKHQPIFIIGAPRTGSTILYQYFTNSFDVTYIDNFASQWYRNLFFGVWLSNKIFKTKPHDNFEAEHGDTFGSHAPSECGNFWYRWLSMDFDYLEADSIDEKVVQEIRIEITAIINFYNRPFVFKNLNCGQRLQLLKRAFPQAKFVFVRRDPRFVVNSLVKSRKEANVPASQWWSVKPPQFKELMKLPEMDMCAAQVYYIEKQILNDLKLFNDKDIFTIHMKDMNLNTVNALATGLGLSFKKSNKFPTFYKDDLERIKKNIELLQKATDQYDFDRELFE